MEERRLLLALSLSLLVMVAYNLLFPPTPRPPREAPKTTPSAVPSAGPTAAATPSAEAGAAHPAPAAPAVPQVADSAERRVEVTSPDLAVAFTNRGARLLTWGLPRFLDKRGRAEDLVRTAPGAPRPLDVET